MVGWRPDVGSIWPDEYTSVLHMNSSGGDGPWEADVLMEGSLRWNLAYLTSYSTRTCLWRFFVFETEHKQFSMWSALFCDITQRFVINPYRRFGTTYRIHLQVFFWYLTLENGIDMLSRNVGRNYHYTLRNIPEERTSNLLRGRSSKSPQVSLSFPCRC